MKYSHLPGHFGTLTSWSVPDLIQDIFWEKDSEPEKNHNSESPTKYGRRENELIRYLGFRPDVIDSFMFEL